MNRNKRVLSYLLVFLLAVSLYAGAPAEGSAWTCPDCGQEGNTGKYCSNCAAARPSGEWTCPVCGQEGNNGKFCSNCAEPRPAGGGQAAAQEAAVSGQLEQIPGETDRVKVIVKDVKASSYIGNKQNPDLWRPSNVADGNETTPWQFSSKKGLKGKSWVELEIDPAQGVDEIWIKNGFWGYNDKGKDQYWINSRPKKIRVSFRYRGEESLRDADEFTLKDEFGNGWQKIGVGHHENVAAVRIAVMTIYKGSKFDKDVCLSEVMLVQQASAAGAKAAGDNPEAVVYESRPDVSGAELLMKLATRTGPGTQYQEPGTFFGKNWKGQTVRVLKKSYDGSIWWVQVEFDYGSYGKYRVWTGLKRVNVDLGKLKEEGSLGEGEVKATTKTYYGPGPNYAKAKFSVRETADMIVWGKENGYLDIEYWYSDDADRHYRVWVPESATMGIYWGNDHSGE